MHVFSCVYKSAMLCSTWEMPFKVNINSLALVSHAALPYTAGRAPRLMTTAGTERAAMTTMGTGTVAAGWTVAVAWTAQGTEVVLNPAVTNPFTIYARTIKLTLTEQFPDTDLRWPHYLGIADGNASLLEGCWWCEIKIVKIVIVITFLNNKCKIATWWYIYSMTPDSLIFVLSERWVWHCGCGVPKRRSNKICVAGVVGDEARRTRGSTSPTFPMSTNGRIWRTCSGRRVSHAAPVMVLVLQVLLMAGCHVSIG